MNTNTPEAVASNAELGIVGRLRANVDSWMPTQPHTREAHKLLTEAADEIERLREWVEDLKHERLVLQRISARRAAALEWAGLHADCTMDEARAVGARLAGLVA